MRNQKEDMGLKVLFVCHGNICRSPMAEFIFKDMVEKEGLSDCFLIESAATSDEEVWRGVGNPVYPPARAELSRHGISCTGKRARVLTREDYEKYDYLIGMESVNIRNMKRILGRDPDEKICKMMSFTHGGGDIADPWYTGDFDAAWSDILEGCEGLLAELTGAE